MAKTVLKNVPKFVANFLPICDKVKNKTRRLDYLKQHRLTVSVDYALHKERIVLMVRLIALPP